LGWLVCAVVWLCVGAPSLAQEGKRAAKAAPAASVDDEDPPAIPRKTALRWLVDASGPFGLLIILLSVLLVGLLITSTMHLRRSVFIPDAFIAEIEQKLVAKDYGGAYELAKNEESFCGKVLAGGMARLSKGYDEAAAGMSEVAEDENMSIDHRLGYISLIGSVSPMLGLLGTVQGMVQAFNVIAASSSSPKPNELAEGIVLALVTTLEGLIVAIPAIVGFAMLKNAQARLVRDAISIADAVVQRITARKGSTASPVAPPAAPSA
jgi:biopolymer transport protein ExbB